MARHDEHKNKAAYRKKMQNRTSMTLITLVIVVLLVVVGIRAYGLSRQRDALQAQWEENERLIEKENQRAQEIEEYGKYTQTLQYYEEVAKKAGTGIRGRNYIYAGRLNRWR